MRRNGVERVPAVARIGVVRPSDAARKLRCTIGAARALAGEVDVVRRRGVHHAAVDDGEVGRAASGAVDQEAECEHRRRRAK